LKKKHVIFDFDGTLINTNEIVIESWQATYVHYRGRREDPKKIYESFGEPLVVSMEREFPDVDTDEAIRIYRNYQETHFAGALSLFPGIMELITKLRAEGHTTSIVTSRTRMTTVEYLALFDLDDKFDVMVSCDDTDAHKPDAEPLLIALDRLGAAGEDAIMIGDSKYDIGCANNAGVDSVLITWSRPEDAPHVEESGYIPTHIIHTPEELEELV